MIPIEAGDDKDRWGGLIQAFTIKHSTVLGRMTIQYSITHIHTQQKEIVQDFAN